MSDYRIEFGSFVGPNDTDRLYQLLSVVSEGDELQITVDQNDPEHINSIIDVLKANEFEVTARGSHDGDKYQIIACRKSLQ